MIIRSKCHQSDVRLTTTNCGYEFYECIHCQNECDIKVSFLFEKEVCATISENNLSRKMSMPHFGQASFSKLSTCHPDLQTLFYEVIKHFDCAVLEGYRNKEDQEAAFKAGNTQLHYPNGKHNHQPSMAVDVAPYPIDFNNTKRFYWFAGYVMGIAQKLKDEGKITHGIRYGGDWNSDKDITDNKFQDLVHFELIT